MEPEPRLSEVDTCKMETQGDSEDLEGHSGAAGTYDRGGDVGLVDWGRVGASEDNCGMGGRRSLGEPEGLGAA